MIFIFFAELLNSENKRDQHMKEELVYSMVSYNGLRVHTHTHTPTLSVTEFHNKRQHIAKHENTIKWNILQICFICGVTLQTNTTHTALPPPTPTPSNIAKHT